MRKILLLFLLFPALHASAQLANNNNDSTLLIIKVSERCNGLTLNFSFENQNRFRYECNDKKPFRKFIKVKRPTPFSCFFHNLRTKIMIRSIKGLALPSDTLEINIDIDKQNTILQHYKGKGAAFSYYYNALERDTGLMKTRKYVSRKDLTGVLANIDSSNRYKMQYLSVYNRKTPLAEWFVEYETLRIIYEDALEKLKTISLYNLNNGKKVFLTPQYLVWIADVPINNPAAIQTPAYYEFLQTYFSLLNKGLMNSGVSSKVLYHFIQTIPDARKQLKPDVFEWYMAYNIQDYYKNGAVKEKLDALILSLKPDFKNETLYNSLLNRSYNF